MSGFARVFGRDPETGARAPGRVNLIGEHIDYLGGTVLPTPIPRWTETLLAAREDDLVRASSGSVDRDAAVESYTLGEEKPGRGWLDYVQGFTRVLRDEGFRVPGFELWVESTIPMGSGVSSSAALLVALGRALSARFGLDLDGERIARIAWRAENEFVGARVGVMDPMACSLGRLGEALLIDTRTVACRRLPLPFAIELVVVDSGIPHRHAGGEYNRRREECERAREILGVEHLCDLTRADLPRVLAALPEPLARRTRHAVTENARVLEAVEDLETGRYEGLGELLDASHRSLREDFEVSTPEIEILVAALRARPGVYGCRITGGGFGGSVLALARRGTGAGAARGAAADYERDTPHHASIVLPDGDTISTGADERRERARA